MGKYPKGPINQHKSMATGAGLRKCNEADKETVPNPWGGQSGVPGSIRKSGTSTGSGAGGKVPKTSRMTPP